MHETKAARALLGDDEDHLTNYQEDDSVPCADDQVVPTESTSF